MFKISPIIVFQIFFCILQGINVEPGKTACSSTKSILWRSLLIAHHARFEANHHRRKNLLTHQIFCHPPQAQTWAVKGSNKSIIQGDKKKPTKISQVLFALGCYIPYPWRIWRHIHRYQTWMIIQVTRTRQHLNKCQKLPLKWKTTFNTKTKCSTPMRRMQESRRSTACRTASLLEAPCEGISCLQWLKIPLKILRFRILC